MYMCYPRMNNSYDKSEQALYISCQTTIGLSLMKSENKLTPHSFLGSRRHQWGQNCHGDARDLSSNYAISQAFVTTPGDLLPQSPLNREEESLDTYIHTPPPPIYIYITEMFSLGTMLTH